MKLHIKSWATALFLTAPSLATEQGRLYISNHQPLDNAPSILTASEARLLIAQRLGLSRFHTLHFASSRTVDAINSYGSEVTWQNQSRKPGALVVIEGIDGLDDNESFLDHNISTLALEQCPSPKTNAKFFNDLVKQRGHMADRAAIVHMPREAETTLGELQGWKSRTEHDPLSDLFVHATGFETLARKYGVKSTQYKQAIADLKTALKDHLASDVDNVEVTVILMPLQPQGLFKRSSAASWGKYSTSKRDHEPELGAGHAGWVSDSGDFPDGTTEDLRPAPIEYSSSSDYVSSPASLVEPIQEDDVESLKSNVTPPRGILPQCYKSMEECDSTTHGCSGHGSCQLKYTTKDDNANCYACACTATRVPVGDQYKTTVWAGPACQKKDVSAPFFLLATTAVGLLSAVAWGIGLLYSMGSQDLPSVIGAGVAVGGSRSK